MLLLRPVPLPSGDDFDDARRAVTGDPQVFESGSLCIQVSPRPSPLSRLARHGRRCAVALVAVLCGALVSCGADDVRERAYASAAASLPVNVTETASCVATAAPRILAAPNPTSSAEVLADCAGTTVFNQTLVEVLPAATISVRRGSVAVTGITAGGSLELTFFTQASGVAASGINEERVILATCWKIVLDDHLPPAPDLTGVTCDEALVERLNPTVVVPFDDLDLSQH